MNTAERLPQGARVLALQASATWNTWLLAICCLGLLVVITGGFARGDQVEFEEWLTYEPYVDALFFALFTLPLVLAYASSLRISAIEGLFLWFVLCTTAYAKDFAYIRLPGTPVYVTDGVLLVLLGEVLSRQNFRELSLKSIPALCLLTFSGFGIYALIRGLSGEEPLRALRDFALVEYSWFLMAGFFIVRSFVAMRRLFLFVSIGAVLSAWGALAWFVTEPDLRRYIAYPISILICAAGIAVLIIRGRLSRWAGAFLITLFLIAIVLANARTIYVAFAAALVFIFALDPSHRHRKFLPRLKLLAIIAAAMIAALLLVAHTEAGADFLERSADELISGTIYHQDDANASFRLLAWAEALTRFAENPLTGEGYGVPFTFGRSDSDPRPHNTFLTVLYKMGILGFLPLALLLAWFFYGGIRTLARERNRPESVWLYLALLAQFLFCIFGSLNLLLESPFLASLFWACLGIGLRAIDLLTPKATLPAGGHA